MTAKNPNDPQFPQISSAFDESLMRETLQNVLFSRTTNCKRHPLIQECRIGERRYKPGSSCTISYRLQILNTETGSVHEQLVCAKLCKKGKSLSEFIKAKSKSLIIVHYLPERSCMIRYRLETENRKHGELDRITVFGKIYRDPIVNQVYRTMSQLQQQSKTLMTAQPLGYDAALQALWQAELPGRYFAWHEINDPRRPQEMELIAARIAEFHNTSINIRCQFRLNDIKQQLREASDYLERTHPYCAERMQQLVRALIHSSNDIEFCHSPQTPIHRDLKIGNILIHDKDIALIDMDTVCLGDPLSDIGSFIANFHHKGLRYRVAESRIRELLTVYCRAYSENVDWQVAKAHLNWYVAASLVYEVIRRGIHKSNLTSAEDLNQCLDLSERYFFGKI